MQAARGMEYLHQQQVVHFDLKCENFLCDLRDLIRPVVKVCWYEKGVEEENGLWPQLHAK